MQWCVKFTPRPALVSHPFLQAWLEDREWAEQPVFEADMTLHDLKDPYTHTVLQPVLESLGRKIEIAVRMNVRSRWASSLYQVTYLKLWTISHH